MAPVRLSINSMRTRLSPICAIAWLMLAIAWTVSYAPRAMAAGEEVDKVVATVDGEPITLQDVRNFAAENHMNLPPGTDSSTFRDGVKGLIEEKLLEKEVEKYADKIDEGQVDKYIEQMEQERGVTDQQLRQSLMTNGVSYDDFRKNARLTLERAMMLDSEVRQKINIPDSEIQAYYDAHKDEFNVPDERYRLAQILIAVADKATPDVIAAAKAKAEDVRKKALAGKDFGTLAKQNSDDESRDKDGELGWFKPDEVMDKILAAVKDLKSGQVSDLVQSSHGFHILKLEEHQLPGPKPLAMVKDQIRAKLTDERAKSSLQRWVDTELAKQHYVETMY